MVHDTVLTGKRILVVDDEPDILETLKDLLLECVVETAGTFEEGRDLLERGTYDAVILDIMGVFGFDLLRIAVKKGVPALMLTAHGLNPDNLVGSIKLGAKSYIPKDRMEEIDVFLKEILIAKQKGVEKPKGWFARLGSFFDDRFGEGWKTRDKKFWEEFDRTFEVSKDEVEKIM